jgi:preprotein translocase subunit YajC
LLWGVVLWQTDGAGGSLLGLLPIVAIFVVFYFLLILPNQKRQKKLQQMLADLKNGDRVTTSGGIRGTIVGIKDEYIVLRVPPEQVKLEMLRSAVSSVQTPGEEQSS